MTYGGVFVGIWWRNALDSIKIVYFPSEWASHSTIIMEKVIASAKNHRERERNVCYCNIRKVLCFSSSNKVEAADDTKSHSWWNCHLATLNTRRCKKDKKRAKKSQCFEPHKQFTKERTQFHHWLTKNDVILFYNNIVELLFFSLSFFYSVFVGRSYRFFFILVISVQRAQHRNKCKNEWDESEKICWQ